jgi:hypothetical protein
MSDPRDDKDKNADPRLRQDWVDPRTLDPPEPKPPDDGKIGGLSIGCFVTLMFGLLLFGTCVLTLK